MKWGFLGTALRIFSVGVIASLISVHCSNNPMNPVAEDAASSAGTPLIKNAVRDSYTNGEGKFQFRFSVPSSWRKTLHGRQSIKGTTDWSDVVVYSPSEQYVPRFTIISFSHNPGYPENSAEFWSEWRENRIKEFYPDRYLGRVERGYATFAGKRVPMVVYDMLDEEKQTSYRSTEYTIVVGGKLCTVQFTTPNSSGGRFSKTAADDELVGVYNSFKIENL